MINFSQLKTIFMLYFKTSKGRLVIDIFFGANEISPGKDEHGYMLIEPGARRTLWLSERIWNSFFLKATPKDLTENEEDYALFDEVIDAQNEDEQWMADQEWMMSMAIHHRKF